MTFIERSRKEGKKYQNPIPTSEAVKFGKIAYKYFTNKEERTPRVPIGPFPVDAQLYNTAPASGLRITWMGHSSLMIEIDGCRLLTDPVIGRASFVQWAGPKRFYPYPLELGQVPRLDAVIISHDHYDHLDKLAIAQLAVTNIPFICSQGVGQHLVKWGIERKRITELDWTDTATLSNGCTVTATPARHFSGRGVVNRNETLWSSFVIKGHQHNVFFGADSGYFPGFKDIGTAYGPFDLTMLEVGAYGEYWPDIHMGPENAVNAHMQLQGRVMMPIHWGTFDLALHSWREPVERTIHSASKNNVQLFIPRPGTLTDFTGPHNSEWWK